MIDELGQWAQATHGRDEKWTTRGGARAHAHEGELKRNADRLQAHKRAHLYSPDTNKGEWSTIK